MNLQRYLRLTGLLIKQRLNRQMIYSVNFWAAFIIDVTTFLIQVAIFSTLFLQVETINGWNRYQMIFFVGTFTVIDSLFMSSYFFGVMEIPEKIRTGRLDLYLTKPINSLFLVSFENIDLGSLLVTVPGIMMLVYSSTRLQLKISLISVIGYLLLVILMLILMYDLMVLLRSMAFWFVKTSILNEFENEMVNFSFRVPGVVFRGVSRFIFLVILPYGLIATVPTQYFTNGLNGWQWAAVFGICGFFTWLRQFVWKRGLKRYGSASS